MQLCTFTPGLINDFYSVNAASGRYSVLESTGLYVVTSTYMSRRVISRLLLLESIFLACFGFLQRSRVLAVVFQADVPS